MCGVSASARLERSSEASLVQEGLPTPTHVHGKLDEGIITVTLDIPPNKDDCQIIEEGVCGFWKQQVGDQYYDPTLCCVGDADFGVFIRDKGATIGGFYGDKGSLPAQNLNIWRIESFYIDDAYRGQGLGRRVFDTLKDAMPERRVNVLLVQTMGCFNHQVYEPFGFKPLWTIEKSHYQDRDGKPMPLYTFVYPPAAVDWFKQVIPVNPATLLSCVADLNISDAISLQ